MRSGSKHIAGFVFSILAVQAGAQERYSLQQLVEKVLAENYQVQIVSNEAAIAENNNTPGNAGFLPTLDAEGRQSTTINSVQQELSTGVVNRGQNATSSTLSGAVALNWTVFDGMRMFAMRDQLTLLAEMGQVDARYYIEQTVADVATAYYQLLSERALLRNYMEATTVSRFRYRLEEKKKAIGSSTGLLFNQAKADYFTDSALVVQQRNTIHTLEIQINRLVNDSLDQPLDLSEENIPFSALESREALVKSALGNSRQLKRAFIEEMIAETEVRIQRAARYPEVDLFANYSYSKQSNEVGFIRSNRNVGPGFGINVRLNLYNGGNTNRAIENAGILRENADLSLKSTTQLVESAVLQVYYQYQSASEQLAIAREREAAARLSLTIAQQQYEAGAINGYDFRLTQVSVINAQNIVAGLEFDIKAAEIELFRLSGVLMDRIY